MQDEKPKNRFAWNRPENTPRSSSTGTSTQGTRTSERNIEYRGHIYTRHNYFSDKRRKIDYVLVSNQLKNTDQMDKLSTFMYNLQKQGVQYEICHGKEHANQVFIKLHCPPDVLQHTANVFNVVFECQNPRKIPRIENWWFHGKIFNNIATQPDEKHPDYHRAVLSHTKQRGIVSWERSFICEKILEMTKYGQHTREKGVKKMCSIKVLDDAYPTHDGPWEWKHKGPLTDRQILHKYWANMRCVFKNQPIRLIYKYYGPEVAFYFTFVDYYTKMLIIPTIIGIISFIYSAIHCQYQDTARITEVCKSTSMMCPVCYDENECVFTPVSDYCYAVDYNVVFDNIIEIAFAIFMTLWATLFVGLWQRREFVFKFHWNLLNSETDLTQRTEFVQKARYTRISPASGERVNYMPSLLKCAKYMLTFVCFILMFALILLCLALMILTRLFILRIIIKNRNATLMIYRDLIAIIVGALLSVIIIQILTPYFYKISRYLTNEENPAALLDYYNRCTYKFYTLSFFNNYVPIIYIALFKGIFFTYPADMNNYKLYGWKADVCTPVGCTFGLTIFLTFFMSPKILFEILYGLKMLYTETFRKRRLQSKEHKYHTLPAWERDYMLHKCGELYMINDFMDVAIQYGIVIFFIASLPLTPLIALISNIVHVRLDAKRILRTERRPSVKIMPGIGPWNSLLRLVTFVGAMTNAFVIAFTSDLIDMEVYRHGNSGSLVGFVDSTLSEFSVSDYPAEFDNLLKNNQSITVCMYRGRRHPAEDGDEKYSYNDEHWKVLFFKLLFVLVFQQMIWLLTAICAKAINPVTDEAFEELNAETEKLRETRFEEITKHFANAQSDTAVDSFTIE